VNGLFVGGARDLDPHLRRLAAAVGAEPTGRSVESKNYLAAMQTMAGCSDKSLAQCHLALQSPGGTLQRETYAAKSHVLDAPLGDDAVAALVGGVNQLQGSKGAGGVLLDALGGAVASLAPDAT